MCDTGRMSNADSLCNQLLIAMPGMADPNFNSTVTLVCEHNAEGALGIVINRPIEMNLGNLFEQLDVENPDRAMASHPVLNGGPVARDPDGLDLGRAVGQQRREVREVRTVEQASRVLTERHGFCPLTPRHSPVR